MNDADAAALRAEVEERIKGFQRVIGRKNREVEWLRAELTDCPYEHDLDVPNVGIERLNEWPTKRS